MILLPKLSLNARLRLYWATGRAQSWYGGDGYSDGVNFDYAHIKYNPLSVLELKAGAISLRYLESPQLVSSGPFPGALVKVIYPENKKFGISLTGLYSIPTSRSLDSDRIEKEKEPSFTTFTLEANTAKSYKNFYLKGIFTKFKYDQLPSKVAYESQLKGNSVLCYGGSDCMFKYGFSGYSFGLTAEMTVSNTLVQLGITRHENSAAPTGYNRGDIASLSISIVHGELIYTPLVELFVNEQDSSVAYYNSTSYGNNNRQGYSISLELDYKKRFTTSVKFIDADLIDATADRVTSRNQMILLSLKTSDINIL